MKRLVIAAFVLLIVLVLLELRALRLMKAEIAMLKRRNAADISQLVRRELTEWRRDEAIRAVDWLHAYASAPEGLRREGGLCAGGRPDSGAIGFWLFDVYVRERIGGASELQARQRVVDRIKQGGEWQSRHSR